MKHDKKWLTTALAVAVGLIIANSSQAQYILGNGASAGITMAGGSFPGSPTTTATGLTLSQTISPPGYAYNYGTWNIPVAQQTALNPSDDTIVFNYTILSPTPGTTGPEYYNGAAWTWYSLQPLLDDTSDAGGASPVRYFGYDGYNLSYGFPSGQGTANSDPGYVYNPANQTVTETASLTTAQKAAIAGGATIQYFQISLDPTSTLQDGFSFNINYIELVPEPTTMALVGLGMAGLVIARRRVSAK